MGLFKAYKTDKSLERKGIVFTPDAGTAITLARAGGSNIKFAKILDAKSKPYRRQIDAGTLDPKLDRLMMVETYAEAIILNWETLVTIDDKDQLIQGIEADPDNKDAYQGELVDYDGTLVAPFSKHNVIATLQALPDMLIDIQRQASASGNFLVQQREDDAKN